MNAVSLIEQYRSGTTSPLEVMRETLKAVERAEPAINAFQWLDPQAALRQAAASEKRWLAGQPTGPLDGLPVAIKDLTLAAGWPTLSGSRTVDAERDWNEDAPSVARLREAGATIFGKTTTPEFGWKGLTDSPLSAYTCNPWDLKPFQRRLQRRCRRLVGGRYWRFCAWDRRRRVDSNSCQLLWSVWI